LHSALARANVGHLRRRDLPGTSPSQVKQAVKTGGNSRKKVESELGGKK
jgi:hypothetical protein